MTEVTHTINNVNDISMAQSDISSLQETVGTDLQVRAVDQRCIFGCPGSQNYEVGVRAQCSGCVISSGGQQ